MRCVRVKEPNIRMPSSTVKHISSSLFWRKVKLTRNFFQSISWLISRTLGTFPIQIVCFLLVLGCQPEAQSQTLRAELTARPSAPARVHVELEFPAEVDALSFRNSYGGVLGLAERIGSIQANSSSGGAVKVEKRAPGEFKLSGKAGKVSYEVDLAEPARLENMSHISWLNSERGLLMPADLLPRSLEGPGKFSEVRMHFRLPSGWSISANVEPANDGFLSNNPDTAVFLIGRDLQTKNKEIGSTKLKFATAGKWPFSTDDAVKAAAKILQEYSTVTAFPLKNDATLMLIPFASAVGPERWTAEARGNAVVLLMGNQGKRRARLNRLGILLSHELFHLWVPNSLSLEGDYDWFFEGFTLYQALLADVKLGLISFRDYLDTIARVYRSYLAIPDRDRLSLIEVSERRWTTSSSLVYDKGMLVAFIYDLALRHDSNCGASLHDIYRELFRSTTTRQENANETIIKILNRPGTNRVVREYVEGRNPLDLESQLTQYGLDIRSSGLTPRLSVRSDLSHSQRRLLKCLGHRD